MPLAYDETNIFAKILRGEVPCHKVYEDDVALAFMDVMPQADGHVLVLPKRPARNILDADPEILCQLMTRVQKIARAVKEALAGWEHAMTHTNSLDWLRARSAGTTS